MSSKGVSLTFMTLHCIIHGFKTHNTVTGFFYYDAIVFLLLYMICTYRFFKNILPYVFTLMTIVKVFERSEEANGFFHEAIFFIYIYTII